MIVNSLPDPKVSCPAGAGIPDGVRITSADGSTTVVLPCPDEGPCIVAPDWSPLEGSATCTCYNEVGVSEPLVVEVPETEFVLGLMVGLLCAWVMAWILGSLR